MRNLLTLELRVGAAALALACAVPAFGAPGKPDFFDGLRAYDARQVEAAIDEWTNAARAGDLRSQKQLGDLYREGRRVPQNFATAYYWYVLASANPTDTGAAADRQVGGALLVDLPTVKSQASAEALKLREALTLGDQVTAHSAVEDSYASRGATGVLQLAEAYRDGKGLPANKVEAYRFFVVASFMGSGDAVKARDAMVTTLQPAQIASAQRSAAEWLKARGIKAALPAEETKRIAAIPVPPPPEPKAPELPAPLKPEAVKPEIAKPELAKPEMAKPEVAKPMEAETPPGVKPLKPPPGREAPLPPELARELAPKDAPQASYLVARRSAAVSLDDQRTDTQIVQRALKVLKFYDGRITGDLNRDTTRAIRSYQRASGNRATGTLTARQLERLLTRAADNKDDSITQYHFARMLFAGRYVDRDVQRALRMLDRSADQGIGESAFFLGVLYRDGVGVPKDTGMAMNRFKEAERLGSEKGAQAVRQIKSSS
jgi:TPR repeat protein